MGRLQSPPPRPRQGSSQAETPALEERRRQRCTLDTIAQVRDARFSQGIGCPRCGGRRVQRWGSAHGRQRYRCLACRRTFSDLTATPAAYLKKLELLTRYVACMRESLSVRESARRIGVHPSTAFRWRHRLLDGLRLAPAPPLAGWIELDGFWLAHSRKGERRIRDRQPRLRAPSCVIGYPGRRVLVLLACDRTGGLATDVAPQPHPDPAGIEQLLAGRTDPDAPPTLVASRGPYGAEARAARKHGWRFAQARSAGLSGPRVWPEHLRTVVAYRVRFLRWLRRFRGVATKYLRNYLAWHGALEAALRLGPDASLLRWPLGPGFG